MSARRRLPNRRLAETIKFAVGGQHYIATVGYFEGTRDPAEVFINSSMHLGSMADVNAVDGAVAVSFALQYGAPFEAICNAMKRNADGSPQGPLGAALDEIKKLCGKSDCG